MENWCSNSVQFSGDAGAIHEITWLFRAMSALEKETGQGQRPPFVAGDDGDIHNIDSFEPSICVATRSVPNTHLLGPTAHGYGAGRALDYHQLGCALFGQAEYLQGTLTDIRLGVEDFEQFSYDLKQQAYTYEGLYYDSDAEILEMMLAIKKEQLDYPSGHRR